MIFKDSDLSPRYPESQIIRDCVRIIRYLLWIKLRPHGTLKFHCGRRADAVNVQGRNPITLTCFAMVALRDLTPETEASLIC
jgi:hypothetical protein